jgi:hypothetical protein
LDGLSTQILKDEIELMRLTTNYRLNDPTETRLHRDYNLVLSEIAYSVTTAGNIVTFSNAFRYHTHPQDFSVGRAEAGPLLIFMGETFFMAKTLGVSAIDVLQSCTRNKDFDSRTFENHATTLESRIRTNLQARAALSGGGDKEQAALQTLADATSGEFVKYYARARNLQVFRITDNLLEDYTSTTGFSAACLQYMAAVRTRPRFTGASGVLFCVSGSGFILHNLMARVLSQTAEKQTEAKLMPKHVASGKTIETCTAELKTLASSSDIGNHKPVIDQLANCLGMMSSAATYEYNKRKYKFIHDQFIDTVEGGANVGSGVVLCNAGFQFHQGNLLNDLDNGRHFLTKFGTSALVFTPSAAAGIVDTPGADLVARLKEKRDMAKPQGAGACDKELLQQRLTVLDTTAKLL